MAKEFSTRSGAPASSANSHAAVINPLTNLVLRVEDNREAYGKRAALGSRSLRVRWEIGPSLHPALRRTATGVAASGVDAPVLVTAGGSDGSSRVACKVEVQG